MQAPPKGPVYNYDPNCWDDTYDYGGFNSFDKDSHMDNRGSRGSGYGRSARGTVLCRLSWSYVTIR